jgi:hypothetical protein
MLPKQANARDNCSSDNTLSCRITLYNIVRLYADDLALLASSQEELQQMLDALSAFCSRYDMEYIAFAM